MRRRRDVLVEARRPAVTVQPDEVQREAHREGVYGAAGADQQAMVGGQRVELGEPEHPRAPAAGHDQRQTPPASGRRCSPSKRRSSELSVSLAATTQTYGRPRQTPSPAVRARRARSSD